MPKLPVVSGHEMVRALQRAGFIVIRQKGSHVSLSKTSPGGKTFRTVVPLHNELATGTLADILRQSGIPREELLKLL